MKKIAIFCGAFNPPLISHFSLAMQILDNCDMEKIIFVPVSEKYNKNDLIEGKHRYNMLKLECDKNPKLEVSDIEINYLKQAYTIETMRNLQAQYINYELYLIMGTDNLKTLDTWHLAEYILQEFKIIALERDADIVEEIVKNSQLLNKYKHRIIKLENIIKIQLCSTEIREKIKTGKNVEHLVPAEILEYIKSNGLYKS